MSDPPQLSNFGSAALVSMSQATNTTDLLSAADASKVAQWHMSMKEELNARQRSRQRRFLTRFKKNLGPAKRNKQQDEFTAEANDQTDPSRIHPEDDIERAYRSNIALENDHFDDRSYDNIEFGDLNPLQYLKKYNLPSRDLGKITRVYFERQREENKRTAMRKHNSRELLNANHSQGNFGPQLKHESSTLLPTSLYPANSLPRRKYSQQSLTTQTNNSIFTPAATNNTVLTPATTTHTIDQLSKGVNKKIRDPLANIDINRHDNSHPNTFSSNHDSQNFMVQERKKLKTSARPYSSDDQVATPGPLVNKSINLKGNTNISIDREPKLNKTHKKVEIVEPSASQLGHIRKPYVQVNGVSYEKVEMLGKGGSSKVYKVRGPNNKIFALKRVSFDEFDSSSVNGFKGEIELLQRLSHEERVVHMYDFEMEDGILNLVMECGNYDLSSVLNNRAQHPLDIEFIRYYAREMLQCVKVVHEAGIIHSDLKPANFVFVKEYLKIIDFGIANTVPDHTVNIYRDTQIGTPNYMAPEALVAMNYSTQDGSDLNEDINVHNHPNTWKVGKPSDIWSCGCIIYQMVYGRPPYGGFQGQNRLLAIMNPDVKISFSERTSKDEKVPESLLQVMKACLKRDPHTRWTIDEVLSSSFFKPINVTPAFIRSLIENAVYFGANNSDKITSDKIEELSNGVLQQLSRLEL